MNKRLNKTIGTRYEKLAEEYLKKKGYEFLERNFKTDLGEIDLIFIDDNTLVFVEVKARATDIYGTPAEAVGIGKQRKISMVASQYIKRHMYFGAAVRFDIIEIYADDKNSEQSEINHIENAFDSYLKY